MVNAYHRLSLRIEKGKFRIVIISLIFLSISIPLHADTYGPWFNRCNSALVCCDSIYFSVDTSDPADPETQLFYSINGEIPWNAISMELNGDPGYETTWEAVILFPMTGRLTNALYYYLRVEYSNSIVITESPINALDQFPPQPENLVSGGNEPVGDAINDAAAWMDLAGFCCGYSANRFYVMLENDGNQWPTSGGFFGPWYIYAAGFSNVTADLQADTVLYALVYANIPFAGISPGLFRVYAGDFEHPERIGDIEYTISGNLLYMSCLQSDILQDPHFGAWPNEYYTLGFGAMTHTTHGYGATAKNDSTPACGFVPHRSVIYDANSAPALTNPGVNDSDGYLFQVTYTDADNHLPVRKLLLLNWGFYEMGSSDHRYHDGSQFEFYVDSLSIGTHHFSFAFSDGWDNATTPVDTLVVCTRGDVTGDGSINVLDALRAVNIILCAGDPATEVEICAADMDGNDQVNVLDVVSIINIILEGSSTRMNLYVD